MMAQFPWLANFGSAASQGHGSSSSAKVSGKDGVSEGDTADSGFVPDIEDDQVEAVFQVLDKKRSELLVEDTVGEPFRCSIRGGAWAQRHLGVAYDAYQGRSATSEAREWCVAYSLPQAQRFNVGFYGEEAASVLSKAWCHHMSWLMAFLA